MIDKNDIEIYLIRHAQCEANTLGIVSGSIDDPLTDEGINQAKQLRELLFKKNIKFDRVYTSTAKRAIDTAKIVSPDLEPSTHSALLEINTGVFETKNDCGNKSAFEIKNYITKRFPKGESYLDLYKRATDWFEKIVFESGNAIGIVAHGGSLGVIIQHILQDTKLINFPLFEISNASLTHVRVNTKKKYFFHTINFTVE